VILIVIVSYCLKEEDLSLSKGKSGWQHNTTYALNLKDV